MRERERGVLRRGGILVGGGEGVKQRGGCVYREGVVNQRYLKQ